MRAGLGTKLRHLLELLDGDVERLYQELGVDFRPRYYPVFRALLDDGPGTIRAIEAHSGLTHSALSQTIAGLRRAGLVTARRGDDGRERWIHLTAKGRHLAVRLQPWWDAIAAAAEELDRELPAALDRAAAALERRAFRARIRRKR